ncbi:polysaccharide deacetylase family protein [Lentzea sp. NBRC 102530]|uniref:polysaccharide deacetylase family protein n=1 Tax=Lentzea sp. NBRC 102530 TaxID=3032201 RepID=UPI0024A2D870|nr:polysaccharide deacetylase family protein [Lentzea sp. NBRC 102530]GLY53088.1 polysaccharide deacetylase [Lentzea sp. NBRC 102530]
MKPVASVSLDLDNLWAYLRTHGDPSWESRPSFLGSAVPRLLDVLGEQRLTTTVFVVGADAERDDGAAAVSSLAAAGHEIANHSFWHQPWLHRFSDEEVEKEVLRAEEAIMAAGAPKPVGFRGPGYSVTPALLDVLRRRGYSYDASVLPTWIGPLARAYHNRTAGATDGGEDLFGGFGKVRSPNTAFRWRGGVVELPVTTMPLLRVPIHGAYLLQLHQVSPRLARAYFSSALRLCLLRKVSPSLLLHPTDVLSGAEAPGMEFFPGMAVPGASKVALLGWVLSLLRKHFDVVGTGAHVARLARLRERDPVAC